MTRRHYLAALLLILLIDDALERGRHFRATDGRLITTLDQAVTAILNNTFPPFPGK